MSRTSASILWWVGVIAITIGIFVGLDRMAWFDQLPEFVQSLLRIACGAVIFAVAGIVNPWRQRTPQSDS